MASSSLPGNDPHGVAASPPVASRLPMRFCGLRLAVPPNGFRPGVDALLLASFARAWPGDRVIDLGAGSGAVSLLLARRYKDAGSFLAVEIDPCEARAIEENARLNQEARIRSICADYTRFRPDGCFHLVVANPPFFHLDRGTLPSEPARLRAKWEVRATMEGTVACTSRLLLRNGRVALIYPAKRTRELAKRLDDHGLAPRRWLHVSSVEGKPPRFVLVEAVHLSATRHRPPAAQNRLALLTREGSYTDAAAKLYGYANAAQMPMGGRRPQGAPPSTSVPKEPSLSVC